jgi:hypothetical protein
MVFTLINAVLMKPVPLPNGERLVANGLCRVRSFRSPCIFSGLLFGIAPAMRSSRVDLNDVLKEGARSGGKHRGGGLSGLLVIFQFALTLMLLTGAGFFVHSLLNSPWCN